MVEIDLLAKEEVGRRFGLEPCLHIPVAARSKDAITRFIGTINCELSLAGTGNAFLVAVYEPPVIDSRLPIWELERSRLLHQDLQVWVHVNYAGYRRAYKKAFPDDDLGGFVLDHILNRKIARLKHFEYLRLIPVSKSVNTSSALSETWGVEYHGSPQMQAVHLASLKCIQYADVCDIVKMLNIKPGGGVMDNVNQHQYLVDLPAHLRDIR